MQRIVESCTSLTLRAKCCALAQRARSGMATPDEARMCWLMCMEIRDTGTLNTFGGPLESTTLDCILGEALDQYIPDQGGDDYLIDLGVEIEKDKVHEVCKSFHVIACECQSLPDT